MTEGLPSVEEPADGGVERQSDGWFGRLALWTLRLGLVVLLGLALGLGVYFGAPALWRAATEPIEANRARIDDLEAELEALKESQSREGDTSAAQLAGLEGQTTAQSERISELEANVLDLERRLNEHDLPDEGTEELSAELESLRSEVRQLGRRIGALEGDSATAGSLVDPAGELQRLRIMELIARARFEILLDNYGLARENMASAEEALRVRIELEPAADSEDLRAALERLMLAQDSLEQTPTLAANNLDSAWRLLVEATGPQDDGS